MFEYTVTSPFTLPLGERGKVRIFAKGEHISDPAIIEQVATKFARNLSRHAMRPKPEPEPAEETISEEAVEKPVAKPAASPDATKLTLATAKA